MKEKEDIINDENKNKAKLQKELDQINKKVTGKTSLIEAMNPIQDQIIEEIRR